MEVTIGQNGLIELNRVYNPIELRNNSNECITICMRDSGFEFTYEGEVYHAKEGLLKKRDKPSTVACDTSNPDLPKSQN
jgi:hypothetical protein|tara:strand:- start:4407 stop:4643 length:237 start_codon:yes stop_codon:yes gene_type:complete